jgi:hypothetical protein
MFNVEDSTYKGVIPRSKIGQTVEFRIVAVDGVGNIAVGKERSIHIGEEFLVTGWMLIVVFIVLIAAGIAVQVVNSLRSRGYLKSEFKGEKRSISDFDKKEVA